MWYYGLPLLRLTSFLSGRTMPLSRVTLGHTGFQSSWASPKGSVLGPLVFILYTADISSLFPKHSASGHPFAYNVQAYVHGPPSSQLLLASKINDLSHELHLWMSSNRLSLNSSKTQLIWFNTTQQLQKLDIPLLPHTFPHFTFLSSISDLGVTV